ncbi:unnamed protein product [Ceutorhynchus assimilis]|uniref:Uncharacterized protein n=1 Tax=Ceutorhynchus assimilis TaxID=467358 RepID=A0A9N9QGA9_9CUCU|nr:unnamed protein product [Ceutorhynchus assimilis]
MTIDTSERAALLEVVSSAPTEDIILEEAKTKLIMELTNDINEAKSLEELNIIKKNLIPIRPTLNAFRAHALSSFPSTSRNELDQVALEWNTHKIRGTKNSRTPVGRPIMMFQIPSLYDAEDKLVAVPQEILNCLNEECLFYGTNCDKDVSDLCKELILEYGFDTDCKDPYDAFRLYKKLRSQIYNLL